LAVLWHFNELQVPKSQMIYLQTFSPRRPPFGLIFVAIAPLSVDAHREESSAVGQRPRAFLSRGAECGFIVRH
jgi:hypothetical protein